MVSNMYFIQLIVDRNPEMMYLFTLPFTVYWRADWPCKAIFERLHFALGKSHASYVHAFTYTVVGEPIKISYTLAHFLSTKNTSLTRLDSNMAHYTHKQKQTRFF